MTLTADTPHLNRFFGLLNSLPVPQTKIALGIVLAFGTFIRAWGWQMDTVTLGLLLGFCTSVLGWASLDYKTKRGSDLDAIAAKGDADAKVASATPAPITQEFKAGA